MANPDLPPCRDFILEVVKEIRKKPCGNQKYPPGTSIERIYQYLKASPYSTDEFRSAVLEMIADDSVVLICACTINGSNRRGRHDVVLDTETVPDWYQFDSRLLRTDYQGNTFDLESHKKEGECGIDFRKRMRGIDYVQYTNITLYIVEDGLPIRAQKAIKKKGKAGTMTASTQAILDRMKK